MSIKTVEQMRAQYALDFVQSFLAAHRSSGDELKQVTSGLPAMVLMNGLGQMAAYCKSQKGVYQKVYKSLSDWLCNSSQGSTQFVYPAGDLLKHLTCGDQKSYRLAQTEALAVLQWLKNMVRAELGG